jgi:hypothetical protein
MTLKTIAFLGSIHYLFLQRGKSVKMFPVLVILSEFHMQSARSYHYLSITTADSLKSEEDKKLLAVKKAVTGNST